MGTDSCLSIFGYYCFHPNNVKPGATTSDISSNMNDQMTFFVRSRITTNFKSNSGSLLVNLFNLSNKKVKDISNVIMIDNEGNQYSLPNQVELLLLTQENMHLHIIIR